MAPNFFSLTNMLLATSFFFALTTAAPVPKTLDVERDNMLLLPTRSMWSEVVAVRPRFSALDNLRIGTTVLPSGTIKEPILPRSPAENSQLGPRSDGWVKASFDPQEGVKADKLKKRYRLAPIWRIGTVVPSTGNSKSELLNREEAAIVRGPATPMVEDEPTPTASAVPKTRVGTTDLDGEKDDEPVDSLDFVEKREIWRGAEFEPEEGVASRDAKIENSPIGPTKLYSGSLWRRSLKNEIVAFA